MTRRRQRADRRPAAVAVVGATSKINVSQLYSAKNVDGKMRFKDDGERQPNSAYSVSENCMASPVRSMTTAKRCFPFDPKKIAHRETEVAMKAVLRAAIPCSK
jgi:hypothetical protein